MLLRSDICKPGHIGWVAVIEDPTRRVVFEGDSGGNEDGLSQFQLLPAEKITELHVITPFGQIVSLPFPATDYTQYKHVNQRFGAFFGTLMAYTIGCRQGEVWIETEVGIAEQYVRTTTKPMSELAVTHKDHPYYQEIIARGRV